MGPKMLTTMYLGDYGYVCVYRRLPFLWGPGLF